MPIWSVCSYPARGNGWRISRALEAWEAQLRPFIDYHTGAGLNQRRFFTQANRMERLILVLTMVAMRVPGLRKLASPVLNAKDAAMKSMDIAAVDA